MVTYIDIPECIQRNIMFHRQIQTGSLGCESSVEVVLTYGPKLFVTKEKQILATCDLSTSVVKGLTCQQMDFDVESSADFDFDVYFTYDKGEKHIFFLLKMKDKLIVLSKGSDKISLHKEYENVTAFSICEVGSRVYLKIEKLNEPAVRDDLYRLIVDYPMVAKERFSGIYAKIANRVAAAKAELETTKLDVQKYFHELGRELRFGPKVLYSTIEERVMLARFGDVWIRRHNDTLLFGVPVYNCCYTSNRLIENIRVTLLSDQLNQFDFDYKLYKFQMDEMSPPNYDEMLGKEENFRFPLFNQEWQPSENNNLHPDCAAIIVIKTCLPNFVDFATLQFDWFLHYEVRDDGKIYNLQNFAGKIAVESSIFYDEKFLATFSKDNVYKDLLTVTSTSKCIFVKLKFNDIATKECFYDFLANFEFAKIIGNCEGNADEKFDFLSTSHLEQGSTNIYFLSNGNSYWTGTLIRTKSHGFVDELKIYNKIEDRILSFIQSIRTRFAENIAIEFADNKCEEIKLIELKHAFQRELNFINDNVNSSNEHFKNLKMKYEYETDSALVNLNKASK